jgi:hypothetical protein
VCGFIYNDCRDKDGKSKTKKIMRVQGILIRYAKNQPKQINDQNTIVTKTNTSKSNVSIFS